MTLQGFAGFTGAVLGAVWLMGGMAGPSDPVVYDQALKDAASRAAAETRESGVLPADVVEVERQLAADMREVARESRRKPKRQEGSPSGSEGLSEAPVSPQGTSEASCEQQTGSLPRGTLGRTYRQGGRCVRVVIDEEQIAEQAPKHGMSAEKARCIIEQHERKHAEGYQGHSDGGLMDATPLDEEVSGC